MIQDIGAEAPRLPFEDKKRKPGIEERVSRVLNELRGSSFTSKDKTALHEVVESYFWEEDDTPNGTAHKQ